MHHASRLLAASAALLAVVSADASAQSNAFSTGTPYQITALTGYQTRGQDMAGMLVSWAFHDGTTGSGVWGNLGGGYYGVDAGIRVRLGSGTDTYGGVWQLRNNLNKYLASVTFSGAPGNTLFDCDWDRTPSPGYCRNNGSASADEGTNGSANGWSFETASGSDDVGTVTGAYTNAVSILGQPAVGDLFEQFTMSFSTGNRDWKRFDQWETYKFRLDTDNSTFRPEPSVVPEPASLALLGAGLVGFVGVSTRRRRTR